MVSTIAAIILPLIGFIKVRLFINAYGSDMNGLQLTVAQVITFLNICEQAYSLAFRQLLFKPLAEKDQEGVRRIYYGAVKIFRITGVIVIAASVVVALLFPYFAESPMDYAHTAAAVLMMALPYGISYFLMGPNFVIMADQKEYKINILIQSVAILRMLFMVLAIHFGMSFFVILVIEAANILVSNTGARFIGFREYPWLRQKPQDTSDRSFRNKAGYAMVQRLSELATTQTDNIVISGQLGYAMSSVYGNYSYLSDNIGKISQSMVTSPMNSFGNLFNDPSRDSYPVFTEFFNFASYLATIVGVCIFTVLPQFIPMWMQHDPLYAVDLSVCFWLSVNIFYMTLRQPVIIVRDANGLYVNARTNGYLLAVVKIVLSIVLVHQLGIVGAVLGTTIAYWTVDFLYNPKLIYDEVFHLPVSRYFRMVAVRVMLAFAIGLGASGIWNRFFAAAAMTSILNLILYILLLGVLVTAVSTAVYGICFAGFRHLFVRLKDLAVRRKERKNNNHGI